jgi:dienelactone hydrolase
MPRRPLIAALATGCLTLLAASAQSSAAVQSKDVKYKVGDTEYVGFVAYDDASKDKRPGILIAPEWVGVNDYARGRAKQLAGLGYVAFVFDPYGGGKNAADAKQSAEWSTALKNDRPELRKRINAGLATLRQQDLVDGKKVAAIGYCFGGTTVLELARGGADVLGVVSFHGGLSTTMPAKPGEVTAKVLVCHGALDPFVPPEEVAKFEQEMGEAKVDWQLVKYADAVHSFTNPDASKRATQGVAYNEPADRRSWAAMRQFFGELFATNPGHAGH